MNICIFQHDPLETPGYILDWVEEKGHKASFVNFHENTPLPKMKHLDGLVILGGPMNVGDEADEYGWLETERDYIEQFIKSGKNTLGICLGSQMIADALGAKVYRNQHTEIGWHRVIVDQERVPKKFTGIFPPEFVTFHWHSYTFDLPSDCDGFIRSEATSKQAFIHENVAAFQFHPEMTHDGILKLVKHNKDIFEKGYPYIQTLKDIIETNLHFEMNKTILYKFLDRFFEK